MRVLVRVRLLEQTKRKIEQENKKRDELDKTVSGVKSASGR